MKNVNEPTTKQIQALATFAAANGRTWKSALRHCWETGLYGHYNGTERSDLLQQVRNQFGPSWLVRFSLKKGAAGLLTISTAEAAGRAAYESDAEGK